MCDITSDPSMHDKPTVLALIPSTTPDANAEAYRLVESGRVLVAKVVTDEDYVLYEAYRLSPTSKSFAWRTSIMAAPAFMPVKEN